MLFVIGLYNERFNFWDYTGWLTGTWRVLKHSKLASLRFPWLTLYNSEWCDYYWIMNWKGCERKQSWHNFYYVRGISSFLCCSMRSWLFYGVMVLCGADCWLVIDVMGQPVGPIKSQTAQEKPQEHFGVWLYGEWCRRWFSENVSSRTPFCT